MMQAKRWMILLGLIALLPSVGSALTSKEVIRLKKAGITDATIELMIREKTVETRAFTVSEILSMKSAGLSEKTLQMLIESNSFMLDRQPVVYGKAIQPLPLATVEDIVALKQAGLSDDVIQAVLLTIGNRADEDTRRAWEMLRRMEIRIGYRKYSTDAP